MGEQIGNLLDLLIVCGTLECQCVEDGPEVMGEGFCYWELTCPCLPPVFGGMKIHPGKDCEDAIIRAGIINGVPFASKAVNW